MRRSFLLPVSLALFLSAPLASQEPLAFQPKVGAIGARVTVKGTLPPDEELRFGTRTVPVLRDEGSYSFLVPPGAVTSFVEVVAKGGKVLSRSPVPFVVTGTSLVASPRLIGLKEAIDVFGYSEPVPESAKKVQTTARPVWKLDDEDVLTIGEPSPPSPLGPATTLSDANSAATTNMGPAGFLLTARPPKKKYNIPPPSPAP